MNQKTNGLSFMTTRRERVSYGTYFLGQNIFYMLLLSFLTVYFTDIGIPAITVAAIALVVKIWDAVNDPIFGGIVDKVRFKSGKFLPWLRVSLVAIPLTTVLIFAIPSGLPLGLKVVWAAVSYILWDAAYTICDVPIFGIVTTMTDIQHERTTLISIGRVTGMAAAILVMVTIPTVRTLIGGWLPTVAILSAIGFATMIPICLTAKERIKPQVADKEVGLKEMFRFVGGNKYLLVFYLALVISYSANIGMTMSMYLARSCFGNEGMASLIGMIGILPTLVVGFFIPALSRKIDKFTLFFWANVAAAVMSFVIFFAGYKSVPLYLALSLLRGIPFGVIVMLMFMFTPDCVEYGQYKTGISAPGVAFSLQTFSTKLTAAISTALGALLLSVIGFVSGEGATQVPGFSDKLWLVSNLVPAIGALLSLPILSRYKLRDKYVQVMARCNAGEISREEAEKVLAGKF